MKLHQLLVILRARYKLIVAVLLAVLILTAAATWLLPNSYTANAAVVLDFKTTDVVGGLGLPLQVLPGYMSTQLDILKSQKVAVRVVQKLKLAENPTAKEQFVEATGGLGGIEVWLAGLISKKLDAKPDRNSSVISIQYTANDPAFAAAVANAFAEAYIETNLEIRVEPARQTAAWFEQRSKGLRDALEAAQAKLSQYQRDMRIVATDERLDVETARLNELSTQLTIVQAQAIESQNRERKAKELVAKSSSADELAEVIAQPVIVNLRMDLARAEAKLKELSAQFGNNHPQHKQLLAQAEETRRRLDSEVERVVGALTNTNTVNQRRESEIRSALEAQREKVLGVKQQRDEIAVLMREVDSAQRSYDMSMQRLMQTSLEGQANQTNITMLSRATPPLGPSSPKPLLNMALAVMLGSMLGFGAALVAESLNRRVRTSDDLRTLLSVPLLGVVPKISRGRSLPLLGAK